MKQKLRNYIILILPLINISISFRSPVVLVPGFSGNQLQAKLNKSSKLHYFCKRHSDYFNIWFSYEIAMPMVAECWIDNLRLIYDKIKRKSYSPDGVEIIVPGWGTPEVIEYLDYYKTPLTAYFIDITTMLVDELGYKRNVSIRGAPYDFRKGPSEHEEYFVKLKTLIEETYTINKNKAVILLSHSLGSRMSLIFLQKQSTRWKKKYIKNFISIGGPWGGTMRPLKVYLTGEDFGSFIVQENVIKNLFVTNSASGSLLPSNSFWKDDEILAQTKIKNYTFADLKQLVLDMNVPNAWEFYKDNEKYMTNLSPPGVEVHCIYGTNYETVERLYFDSEITESRYLKLHYGNGDGSVNIRSLRGCLLWKDKQMQKVYHKEFKNLEHQTMLNDKKLVNYIKNVINNLNKSI